MNNTIGWLITLTPVANGIQDAPIWRDTSNDSQYYVRCERIADIPETVDGGQILVLDSQGEKPSGKLLGMGYRPEEIDE